MRPANVLRLVALAIIWGSSFLFIKLALEGLAPMQIVLGRLTSGAGVLLVFLALSGGRLPRSARIWGHFAFLGVVTNIVPYYLFGWGEERIASSLAGVLNATTPLFTLAFAVLALRGERVTRGRLAGFVVGFSGVVLVIGPWNLDGGADLAGMIACLGAAACYGVGFVWSRRFLTGRGIPAVVLGTGQILAATLELWIASPLLARGEVTLSPLVLVSVLILGAGGTGVAYVLVYRLIEEAGATTASLVTYLMPIVAVALGGLVLAEPLTWNLFAGAAVVIAGVMLAEGRLAPVLARGGRP